MLFKKSLALVALSVAAGLFCAQAALADCNIGHCYGALAAGEWRDSDGTAHVSAGTALNYGNEGEAQQGALQGCHGNGGMNCAPISVFSNGGCGYIATGHSDEGVNYGTGPTSQAAYNNCSAGGYDCSEPIGGCTAGR